MHILIEFLRTELKAAADPKKAKEMQAYMKTTQRFYGVQAPVRKQSFKKARSQFEISSFGEYQSVIKTLWNGESREEMYQALEVAGYFHKFRRNAMDLFEELLESASNWDTVDWIAGQLVSQLLRENRIHEQKLRKWRESDNFWMRRASVLAHLHHKNETNLELLSETIVLLMHEEEFFIRKAIGWILRDYSRFDPNWVNDFVKKNHDGLSGLSRREALKRINRGS
ncbi:MAG: DNA alkylation repair protein [SAR324 cluster bacterium]|nr:DNA alkylation repair protein [SAR324 cluster bacterium]